MRHWISSQRLRYETHFIAAVVLVFAYLPFGPLCFGASTAEKAPPQPAESAYDEGFWFISPDDKLRVGSQAQVDTRIYSFGSPSSSTFQIRRARIYATGVVEEKWGYMVMGRWDRGTVNLHFAWIESQHSPHFRVRLGQFKQPYSLEGVNSDQYFDFDERSIWTSNLSQLEDLGVMLYGKLFHERVEHGFGFFNGRGRERDDSNEGKEGVGQLTLLPFKDSDSALSKGLAVSFSGSIGKLENDLKESSYSTAAQTKFWTYGPNVVPNGNKSRTGAELEWIIGPGSLKGGWHRAKLSDLQNGSVKTDLKINGWHISGSYLPTGEDKPRNRAIKPRVDFDPSKGTWGGLEAVARYELFLGEGTALQQGFITGTPEVRSYTLGLNWYWNRHMRSLFAFQHSSFGDPVNVGGGTIDDESTWKIRVQFEI